MLLSLWLGSACSVNSDRRAQLLLVLLMLGRLLLLVVLLGRALVVASLDILPAVGPTSRWSLLALWVLLLLHCVEFRILYTVAHSIANF